MDRAARLDLIRDLRERTRQIEASRRAANPDALSTGFDALDQLLPGPGLPWGTLTEWLNECEGGGALTLALAIAAKAVRRGGAFVMIDGANEFYPPAAAQLGIPLDRMLVVHPDNARTALWAWEQALRCEGVAATLGWIAELSDRPFRRLQLAAETGGGLGFLLRPPACRATPSWAAARLSVTPRPGRGPLYAPSRRLRIALLHGGSEQGGAFVEVELCHEADDVHLVSELADPKAPRRAALA